MLEKSFKAIECHVVRWKTIARRDWPDGSVYQPTNLAGEQGKRATSEVVYTDAMVCEGSAKHHRPFSRSPFDHETYYNVIQRSASEAMEECMGIPKGVKALSAEPFDDLSIQIETRLEPSPFVIPDNGYVQGSYLASESSKPAQAPILCVRAERIAH